MSEEAVVTEVTGDEEPPTQRVLDRTCWLLRHLLSAAMGEELLAGWPDGDPDRRASLAQAVPYLRAGLLADAAPMMRAALEDLAPGGGPFATRARRVAVTLRGGWSYEELLTARPGEPELPQPPDDVAEVRRPRRWHLSTRTGRTVPATGLWLPTGFGRGCPNVLIVGDRVPPARRPVRHRRRPDGRGEWEHAEERSTWRLLEPF